MSYGSERRTYSSGGGSDIGSRRSFSQKPVEVGKEYDVQIMETSRRGDGEVDKGVLWFK